MPNPLHTPTEASPHTRGWTVDGSGVSNTHAGFPAHAGMDPTQSARPPAPGRLPRTRGDGPVRTAYAAGRWEASPHTRGWTRCREAPSAGPHRLPRTRGDGPGWGCKCHVERVASPHTRGWTPREAGAANVPMGFPAHAGMDRGPGPGSICPPWLPRTRGDGPGSRSRARAPPRASPHTRGWTRSRALRGAGAHGFPAHAGMDPGRRAPAGRRSGLPRTRGDGPVQRDSLTPLEEASPHTRGWTPGGRDLRDLRRGFPAHAGMDPPCASWPPSARRLPRTRGDGPLAGRETAEGWLASPHTRGWTRRGVDVASGRDGFPAHAGMDPCSGARDAPRTWLPRTRGDGPG